jgi:serine/threonine protein kinase
MDEPVSTRSNEPLDYISGAYKSSNAVQILKVLGEGGFSFVYLAQDEHSGVSDTTLAYILC